MNRKGTAKKRVVARREVVARAQVLSIADDTVHVRCDGGSAAAEAIGADFGVRVFVTGPYWKCAATVIEDRGNGELVLDLQDVDLDTKVIDLRPIRGLGA